MNRDGMHGALFCADPALLPGTMFLPAAGEWLIQPVDGMFPELKTEKTEMKILLKILCALLAVWMLMYAARCIVSLLP